MNTPLTRSPTDYQLTVHYHNYDSIYGHGTFILHFDKAGLDMVTTHTMDNFISYYGHQRIEQWLSDMLIRRMVA
jgi:hypothetical protein